MNISITKSIISNPLFIIFILFSISLSSCSIVGKGKMAVTKEKNLIPPDFGTEPTVLLIRSHFFAKDQNKLEKIVKKHYTEEYEFIHNMKYDSSPKYKNKNKYRYVYYNKQESSAMPYRTGTGGTGVSNVPSFRPVIIDRKTNKEYIYSISINSLSIASGMYMKALSKEFETNIED